MDPPCLKLHLDAWRIHLAALGIWNVDYSHSCLSDRCDRMNGFIVSQPRCGSSACTVSLWGCLKSGQHHICTSQTECRHVLSSDQIIGRPQDDESYGDERCRDAADLHLQYVCLFSRRVVGSEFAPDDYRAETDVGASQHALQFALERGEFWDATSGNHQHPHHYGTDGVGGMFEDGEEGGAGPSQADAVDSGRRSMGHMNRPRKRRAQSPPTASDSPKKKASTAGEKRLTIAERLDAQTRRRTTQLLSGSAHASYPAAPHGPAIATTTEDSVKVHQFVTSAEGRARAAPNTVDRRRSSRMSASASSDRVRRDREQRIRESLNQRIRTAMNDPMLRRHVWMARLPHPLQHHASNVMEYSSTWPSDTVGADYSIVENVRVRETATGGTMSRLVEGDPTLNFEFSPLQNVKYDVFKASIDWKIARPPLEDVRASFARLALEKQMGRCRHHRSHEGSVTFEDPTSPAHVRQSCKSKIQTTIDRVCCDYYWQEQALPSVTAVVQTHLTRIIASIASPAAEPTIPRAGVEIIAGVVPQDRVVITETHNDVAVVMARSLELSNQRRSASSESSPSPPPPSSSLPSVSPRLTVTRESVRKCTKWIKGDVESAYCAGTWMRDALVDNASARSALRLYAILLESGIYATIEFARILDDAGLPNETTSVLEALVSGMAQTTPQTSTFVVRTVDIISRKLHPSVLAEVLAG